MGSRSRPFLLEGGLLPFVAAVLDQQVDDIMVFLATVVTTVSTLSFAEMEREATPVSNVVASLDGVVAPAAGDCFLTSLLVWRCADCNAVLGADGGEVDDIKVETADVGVDRISLGTCAPLGTPSGTGG
jgi:hypothetical protein